MSLRKFLIAVVLILVALLGISFFLPKDMNMAVTKQLNASPDQVFVQVNNLKNWGNWSPWDKLDPDMEKFFAENYIGEGGSYTWKSEKKSVGNGGMTINESILNEKVVTTLTFEGMDDGHATLLIEPNGDGSNVTWDFSSDYSAKMPWSKWMTAMYRFMLNRSYNKGLDALDAYIAENPESHLGEASTSLSGDADKSIGVIQKEVIAFNGVTVNRKGLIADMAENGEAMYGQAFGEVGQMIAENEQEISGMPFTQGISWDEAEGTYEIEIGIPVKSGGKEFGGGKVVMAEYYGPYHGVGAAHEAIEAYIEANELEVRGGPWEIYANDPGDYPDPADWLTEVYYPVN